MLVTAPSISRLMGRPRLWGYRQMRAGRYGRVERLNGHHGCVFLANVEVAEQVTFSRQQLIAAGLIREDK
jgi:hypothetical protein